MCWSNFMISVSLFFTVLLVGSIDNDARMAACEATAAK